jgi:3-phenylpropionate/cinnamic acid dioxygenase small subunit
MSDGAMTRTPALQHEVTQFLYHEAFLLDQGRYAEWLDLLTDDVQYLMPTRPERNGRQEENGAADLAYLEENRLTLGQRVERLESGMAWAETPASRTARMVGNVVVVSSEDHRLEVRSLLHLYRHRSTFEVEQYSAYREDEMRRAEDNRLRIRRRTILLVANGLPGKNLALFF